MKEKQIKYLLSELKNEMRERLDDKFMEELRVTFCEEVDKCEDLNFTESEYQWYGKWFIRLKMDSLIIQLLTRVRELEKMAGKKYVGVNIWSKPTAGYVDVEEKAKEKVT